MKKGLTELVFIIDRSGSMQGLEGDTIGGFNATLEAHKNEAGEALVTTVLFDDKLETLHDRLAISEIPPMTRNQYFVRGCTALLDAVGNTVEHIGRIHKYLPEEHVPEHTIVVITTDGMENASSAFTYPQVKALIEAKKEQGWDFLFLGANIDAAAEAESLGIGGNFAATYVADSTGTQAMHASTRDATIAMRAGKCTSNGDWRKEIDQDMARRKKVTLDTGEIVSKKKRWPFKKH
ncbi:MAG: hypothetical protein ACI4B9_04075 [Eggerthellaceae bacterium]